jgi:ABC-2 type transport system ATP-binding protein
MVAVRLENLEKTYPNGVHAVRGVNLEINSGDFFGLLGPNGAGKTTIIGIINSLVGKSAGKVFISKHDIDINQNEAKSLLGIVPQEINLGMFEKAIDIVVNQAGFYGLDSKSAYNNAEKYLKVLQLWDKRNEITRNYSGGMKRRLMIARALVHEPDILILDEPTAGVDIEVRYLIWDFLQELNESGKTIILTSHYLEEIEHLCNKLAILNNGKIVKQGTVKSIINKLQAETFIMDLSTEVKSQKKLSAFKNVKLIDSKTIEITTTKTECIGDIISRLTADGLKIKSMRNKVNRLEELFLQLTKKSGVNS